jgi:hypothetical protein
MSTNDPNTREKRMKNQNKGCSSESSPFSCKKKSSENSSPNIGDKNEKVGGKTKGKKSISLNKSKKARVMIPDGWVKMTKGMELKYFKRQALKDTGAKVKRKRSIHDIFMLFFEEVEDVLFEDLNIILDDIKPEGRKFTVKHESFMAWLRIWLRGSINCRKTWRSYWNIEDPDLVAQSTMGRDTWLLIYRAMYYLHDSTLEYMDTVIPAEFTKHWIPSKRIAVDETMRRFKGKSKHKVYAPDKPIKRGLKLYLAVDDSGFCI